MRGRGPSRGRGGPGGRHSGEPRFNSGNQPNVQDYFNNIDNKKGPPSGRGRGGTSNGRMGGRGGSGRGKGGGGADPK